MDLTAAATLFAWLDREVWLVTARADPRRGGLIATAVCQASSVPELPRVLVALGNQHHTRELVEASGAFALHLLAEENLDLVWQFGLSSGRDGDKFGALATKTAVTGSPLLEGTIGWLDCRVEARQDVGDRTLYVAEIVEGRVTKFAPPLTTRRLMELAPMSRLTQLQSSRHHQGYTEAEALRSWREAGGAKRTS
jgi:flavin reductase (DIM6/NTAB) family NADH-FMN oxidoreductase RutF